MNYFDKESIKDDFIQLKREWAALGFWGRIFRAREYQLRLDGVMRRDRVRRIAAAKVIEEKLYGKKSKA